MLYIIFHLQVLTLYVCKRVRRPNILASFDKAMIVFIQLRNSPENLKF